MPLRSWFEGHGLAGKLRAIQTVSCLLQGPCDAGNRALELSGVMESVIALCASEREEEQLVAVEALIHAAGKAKRASFITANGVSLLKDLYKGSERDSIRIRALVVRWEGAGRPGVLPLKGYDLVGGDPGSETAEECPVPHAVPLRVKKACGEAETVSGAFVGLPEPAVAFTARSGSPPWARLWSPHSNGRGPQKDPKPAERARL